MIARIPQALHAKFEAHFQLLLYIKLTNILSQGMASDRKPQRLKQHHL
jgi:hypothetical protein